MPVQSCESNGLPAYRWGEVGKAYTYTPGDEDGAAEARKRAFVNGMALGETAAMNDGELEAARLIQKHAGYRLAKDVGGNLIVAWYPFDGDDDEDDQLARDLALPYGLAPEDLHITLLYLGDPGLYDLDLVAAVIKIFSVCYWSGVEGCISGLGRFVGEGEEDVIVALVDSPYLANFRDSLKEELSWKGAIPWESPLYQEEHGFVPHITLAYVPRTQSSPPPLTETIPFCIDSLTVRTQADSVTFPLYSPYSENVDAAMPYYAARESVAKAGRVLSTKNHGLVTDAIDALTALHDAACDERCNLELAEKQALRVAEIEKAAKKVVPSMYNADGSKADPDEDKENPANVAAGGEGSLAAKGAGLEYYTQISKADDEGEYQYTFGPLYAPERKDAHGEGTDATTLQKALWEYVQNSVDNGDNRINLQHDDSGEATIGNWVEACAWPYETTIKITVPGEAERELVMPAGTVYMGVRWDKQAWDEGIKKGRITGYSLGGRAIRVSDAMGDVPDMGDKLAAAKAAEARDREIELAAEVGAVAAERKVYRDLNDRLLDVLGKHAESGVTINENGAAGLEALLEP